MKNTTKHIPIASYCLAVMTISLLLTATTVHAYQPVTNFKSVIRVNGIVVDGDNIWMASSGGLYCHTKSTASGRLYTDTRDFPDLDLTSIHQDKAGSLWIGTAKGFLYKRTPSGTQAILSGNTVGQWSITQIVPYGTLLLIASPKGCAVFDTEKMQFIKNTSHFSTFNLSTVNTIAVFKDTLYVGCPEGTAKLDIFGDQLRSLQLNFYDRSIWRVDTTVKPVLSFRQVGTVIEPLSLMSVRQGDVTYTASDATLSRNDSTLFSAGSGISCIIPDGNGCWVGTKSHYAYQWDGTTTTNVVISGPTFNPVTAITVDRSGSLWVLPPSIRNNTENDVWTMGISRFDGKTWNRYGVDNSPGIGTFPEDANRGITEDPLGNIWAGTKGGNVKHFTRKDTSWQMYCINNTGMTDAPSDPANAIFRISDGCPWGWCDAIATDSSGFVWLGNNFNRYGSLICVDPGNKPDPDQPDWSSRHYRRFFPGSDPNYMTHVSMLHVMKNGTILAGSEQGDLVAMTHNGDPLRNDVTVLNRVTRNSVDMGKIYAATNTPDGIVWIAAAKGVFKYTVGSTPGPVVDLTMTCTGISTEEPNRLWLATMNQGLIKYDIGEQKQLTFTTDHGLPSNSINDVFVDKSRGCVWAATSEGISRLDLGYAPGQESDGSKLVAYPNPFKLRSGGEIIFKNAPSGSTVSIYSTSGALLGTATSDPKITSAYGQRYLWRPKTNIVPGTCFYVVRSVNYSTRGKLLIIP